MRRIVIEAVPREEMRAPYNQEEEAGDWFYRGDDVVVRVIGSDILVDETFLYGLHELVEFALCYKAGVTQEEVDAFDLVFEGEGEPGDAEDSPYRRQHRQACLVEFLVADMLNVRHGIME